MNIILVLFAVVYLLGLGSFLVGLRRGLRRASSSKIKPEVPKVSVLVCARNEEKNIDACLESLSLLEYPFEKLQIVVVNDNSEDSTESHLLKWKDRMPNLEILNLNSDKSGTGKVNALIEGIEFAHGTFIFITDADCQVPAQWINDYLLWYKEDTGMVSSITIHNSTQAIASAISLEMIQLLGMSMAGINIGIPVSIIGNNLSIRKEAYEDIGGYRNIPFSVTEDVALFQAMWRSRWGVKFKANDDLLVKTNPPASISAWWRQKQRWVIGAKSIGFIGWFILLLGYCGMFAAIGGFFVLDLPWALVVLAAKSAADLLILVPIARSLRQQRLLIYFPLYQVYLLFFLLCVPLQYFQKTVVWKGRDYHT